MEKLTGTEKVKAEIVKELEEIADFVGDVGLADQLFWSMVKIMNVPQLRELIKVARKIKEDYLNKGGKLF
jgi:hypothetical protein